MISLATLHRPCILAVAFGLSVVGCSDSDSTDSEDNGSPLEDNTSPIISADNAETLLREIIAIANDDALNDASASVDPVISTVEALVDEAILNEAASGNGLTFMSSVAINEGGSLSEYTFSCDSGGTLVVQAHKDDTVGGPYIDDMRASNACSIDDATYDGFAHKRVNFVRNPEFANFEYFSVSHANGDSMTLHGEFEDTSPENRGPLVSISWTGASLVRVENGETINISDYSSLRNSLMPSTSPGTAVPYTRADANFTVSAPWTSGEALDVVLDLAYASSDELVANDNGTYPAQWHTGTLRLTAADGSGLTLSPDNGDDASFTVAIDGSTDEPMTFNWEDGFQVRCAPDFECL